MLGEPMSSRSRFGMSKGPQSSSPLISSDVPDGMTILDEMGVNDISEELDRNYVDQGAEAEKLYERGISGTAGRLI